ncbi:MAG TPA: hypothetical protein VM925_03905 [Labilithrix sp.]|jgi:hypothetical protein|nr:hypothetical protein [Labilithrix sp.]
MSRPALVSCILLGTVVLIAGCNEISGASDFRFGDRKKTDIAGNDTVDASSPDDSSRGLSSEQDASTDDAGSVDVEGGCKTTPFMRGRASTGSWDSLPGALSSDGQGATYKFTVKNVASPPLKVTDFGFDLPATAQIKGVIVRILRSASTRYVKDSTIQLLDGDTEIGNNQGASSLEWPTAFQTKSYGDEHDLWGTNLTPAVANASTFGITISCGVFTFGSLTSLPVASVDEVSIALSYCD